MPAPSSRPAGDVARDADRHPEAIVAFAGVEPGMTVADLMAGRGYFTEVFAHAVGPQGTVYAHNNEYVLQRFADGPLTERLSRSGLEQVRRVDAELDALPFEPGSVDVVFMGLFYHDTYWMQADRAAMNAAIYRALDSNGVYVVTDHSSVAGAGVSQVKTLHRIEQQVVVDDIVAAGFVLDAESDVLRHPEDPRTASVFDDELRGKSDRFVLRFRKP